MKPRGACGRRGGSAWGYAFALVASCSAGATETVELQLIEQRGIEAEALLIQAPTLSLQGADALAFTQLEMSGAPEIVSGRPFRARSLLVRRQRLADGNTITVEQQGRVYRDEAGRTRHEDEQGSAGARERQILLSDPVAGTSVLLFPERRTARPLGAVTPPAATLALAGGAQAAGAATDGVAAILASARAAAERDDFVISLPLPGAPTTVTLGERHIAGQRVSGTRTTVLIPASAIGNREAISIVTEQWYSAELGVVVASEHRDPRFGETRYELSEIERVVPAPALFVVPLDYRLHESARTP